MSIEEQTEEEIQNAVQTIITGGAKLMLRVPKGVAMVLLRSGMKFTKTGAHAVDEAVKNKVDSGEMFGKRLQRRKGGDLHELQFDDSAMRGVQYSLKTVDIDCHLERTDQGQFILHFADKDEGRVRHAVQHAFKGMGLDVTGDDFTIKQTGQTRDEPEPLTRETPAEPAMKPMPTQRITWDFADPEVMGMAANSPATRYPGLSWNKLMGDTTRDEQAGHDFTGRIIGKAAADPSLRGEFDATPCDDYRQGAQIQEQTRKRAIEPNRGEPAPEPESEPEPMSDEARTPVTRQQAQARADNPRPAGRERKPKLVRSRKALLEWSRTRLSEDPAEQKNHMPSIQNRDRMPHKDRRKETIVNQQEQATQHVAIS